MEKSKKEGVNKKGQEDRVDKKRRDFLKGSAGVVAITMLGGNIKASALELQDQDKFLSGGRKQNFEKIYPGEATVSNPPEFIRQMELVAKAASTGKDRAEFIADPYAYAEKRNVELDMDIADVVSNELLEIERHAAGFGSKNPYLDKNSIDIGFVEDKIGSDAHVAGVVASAAAVVGAVAAVTMAYTSATATRYC